MKGAIPIGDARRISEDRKCPLVVIFGIEANGDRFTVTSYGATRALCRVAAQYADKIAEAVLSGKIKIEE